MERAWKLHTETTPGQESNKSVLHCDTEKHCECHFSSLESSLVNQTSTEMLGLGTHSWQGSTGVCQTPSAYYTITRVT